MRNRITKCLVVLIVFTMIPLTPIFDTILQAFPCIYAPQPLTICSGTDVACPTGCPAPPTTTLLAQSFQQSGPLTTQSHVPGDMKKGEVEDDVFCYTECACQIEVLEDMYCVNGECAFFFLAVCRRYQTCSGPIYYATHINFLNCWDDPSD